MPEDGRQQDVTYPLWYVCTSLVFPPLVWASLHVPVHRVTSARIETNDLSFEYGYIVEAVLNIGSYCYRRQLVCRLSCTSLKTSMPMFTTCVTGCVSSHQRVHSLVANVEADDDLCMESDFVRR